MPSYETSTLYDVLGMLVVMFHRIDQLYIIQSNLPSLHHDESIDRIYYDSVSNELHDNIDCNRIIYDNEDNFEISLARIIQIYVSEQYSQR